MSKIAERIAELSPQRRALLERLLKHDRVELSHEVLRPRPRQSNHAPLSFAQQRLWLIDQLEPGNNSYNTSLALNVEGTLDIDALMKSINEVVRRHEVLRTTFITVDESPVQVIAPSLTLTPTIIDLSDTPASEQEELSCRIATEEADQLFDLARGPLLRVKLLKLNEQFHILLMTYHHIVTDGWSMDLFSQEMGAAYGAYVTGQPVSLPQLPVQYADFAIWQREWLSGAVLEKQLGYWRKHLGGELPVLELPTDRARPAVQTYRGACEVLELSTELSEQLRTLCKHEGVTLYMLLLAAFKIFLHRYTGQTDITAGTPIANRNRMEIENLIGFFVNTLVLRTDLSGNPTFRELLGRVREVALGAYAHQDVPFEKLVEELQPERSFSHSPLFQVMFAVQTGFETIAQLPGLELTMSSAEVTIAQFDLSLDIVEEADYLICLMQYRTDLFESATIRRMLDHFNNLLEGIVAAPQQRIGELPLLAEDERQRALLEWNDTARDYPRDACIHQLFETQTARTPDAVAVVFDGEQLTYGDLNRRANQLARHLQRLGIAPETRVGILLKRSIEMPVALLGVLKAGGAYVALDPAYPPERLRYMLADSGIEVLLTNETTLAAVDVQGARVVRLDAEWPSIAQERADDVQSQTVAANLAYLVYTSGTTGQPKGILVEHRSLVNAIHAFITTHAMTQNDRLLQFASLSFDVAAEEFFSAWLSGACAVMRSGSVLETQAEFVTLLEQEKITVVNLPASFWSEWLAALAEGQSRLPERLRRVVVGNEKTMEETLARWRRTVAGRVAWSNAYGPTETTITASNFEPESGDGDEPRWTTTVPIGRPVMNAEMYVLDASLQLVPVGVAGELYIGGAGVARGYHGQAGQTAERFVPHPYSVGGGARLYRTGDVARYVADGNVEFVGRVDEQVKIRGFRIETGEVEAVLAAHGSVRDVVVVAREDGRGNNQLVAYVVTNADADASPAVELRRYMQQRLPDYMLPAAFVMMEALPLTPNGKVDRRALPAPADAGIETATEFVAPRTPVEEMLAGMWSEILNVKRIGLTDNFFESGGHSLLATRVVSRIRQTYGVELPLRLLFESPTVGGLAAHIELAMKEGSRLHAPPVKRVSRDANLPLSFGQQRLWLLHQLDPDDTSYNMPDAILLEGRLNVPALEQTFSEIVRRHEALRTTFQTIDNAPVQVIAPPAPLKLSVTDLSRLPAPQREDEMHRLATEEAQRPFNLSTGPLLRLHLLKLDEEEHVLLMTTHHVVSDGWSFGVLVHELSTLYAAFDEGKESPLEELEVQYADFAVWQREWLSGAVLEEQLAYWRGQLGGELPVLELPTDRARPVVQSHRGAVEYLELPTELSEQLKTLSQREGVTLYMLLLATFKVLLYRYTGQTDICVGMPIAGRNRAETEDLIGFFINTLVLRTNLSGNPTFREFLAQVRKQTLDAYVHQDLPFEKLVEELQPERSLSHAPLFQLVFTMQNAPGGELKFQGIDLSDIDVGIATAKYELSLSITESDEGLAGSLVYNSDLFDASTIRRLLGHFQTLLDAIAADAGQHVADVPLLTPPERQQLLVEWNTTARDYPQERCVHELFEEQAARTPDAVALVFEGEALTFDELNRRANRLARGLRARGIVPDATVGILMERSPELIVALLGVWKAGGAFVPLDCKYPQQRLALMLEETGACILLTQQRRRDSLPRFDGEVLCIDADHALFAEEPTTNLETAATPEHLAYIFYTSGSTGRPKGVLAAQRGVVNYLNFIVENYRLSATDTVMQVASLTFDASVRDIMATLVAGAKLVLVNDDDARDPRALLSRMSEQRVTCILSIVPTLLHSLVETAAESDERPDGLRLILSAGENLLRSEASRAQSVFGGQLVIFNQYGATECTMSSTFYQVHTGEAAGVAPVGRPIANSQVYILDEHLNPCPVGVAGEVHIGSVGLARGYLQSPELTAQKYIPHPYGSETGVRLYKTGDLARYLPDGNIELMGRRDYQVKVRGMRIELGEIESALRGHENVREAAVVVREDVAGDKRLVAYVVVRRASPDDRFGAFLKERVPDYMVPTAFVVLDALPLTPHGKVDRAALPAPDEKSFASARTFVAPRTPVEESLAHIWQDVLGVKQVGIHDNFFELGGHSILATQVMSRIRKTLRAELPLRILFERPTVADLALSLEPNALSETSEMEKLARILEEVDKLSLDEARALLEGT